MKAFTIQAYGGARTNGSIAHFRVNAETLSEAIDLVKRSSLGGRYGKFDCLDETGDLEFAQPGIVEQGDGPVPGRP